MAFDPAKDFLPVNNTPTYIPPAPEKKKGFFGRAVSNVGNAAVGFGKGALDTVASVPRNIKKVGDAVYDVTAGRDFTAAIESINASNEKLSQKARSFPKGSPEREKYSKMIMDNLKAIDGIRAGERDAKDTYEKDAGVITKLDKYTTPTNKAQQVGFGLEKIGEFLVPASKIAAVDKSLSGLNALKATTKGASVINPLVRVGSKAGVEGLGMGGVSLAQSAYQGRFDSKEGTTGALKDARNVAATAGVFKGLFSGAGEILSGRQIPKKLYTQIYKETPKDMAEWFRKANTGGKNKTIADWAIDKNIHGNFEHQAGQIRKILSQSEKTVVNKANQAGVRIEIPENLKKMAVSLKAEYKDFGRGESVRAVDAFIKSIDDKGTAGVSESLKFRRFLDGLRSNRSFSNPKIGDEVAYWADDLRSQVNAINNIGKINRDYAFAIRAKDSLMNIVKQSHNQDVVTAMEKYFAGAGALAGEPLAGLGVIAAKRVSQGPAFRTAVAQGIRKLGENTGTKVLPYVPKIPGSLSPGIRGMLAKYLNDQTKEGFISPE